MPKTEEHEYVIGIRFKAELGDAMMVERIIMESLAKINWIEKFDEAMGIADLEGD